MAGDDSDITDQYAVYHFWWWLSKDAGMVGAFQVMGFPLSLGLRVGVRQAVSKAGILDAGTVGFYFRF